jgi:hypothetical protein
MILLAPNDSSQAKVGADPSVRLPGLDPQSEGPFPKGRQSLKDGSARVRQAYGIDTLAMLEGALVTPEASTLSTM